MTDDNASRFANLEQRSDETVEAVKLLQTQIARLLERLAAPKTPSPHAHEYALPPSPLALSPQHAQPRATGLRPAHPPSFNGDRARGRPFLNAVHLYLSLCPEQFPDDATRINWVLSFMNEGRAARFAARVLRHPLANGGLKRFHTFTAFESHFIDEFCERDEIMKAVMALDSNKYFQGRRTVDEYVDEFLELTEQAQYHDGAYVVMRFRHGLDPQIQTQIATMASGRPDDTIVRDWIEAAR